MREPTQAAKSRAAWEMLHYALRNAMTDMDADMVRYFEMEKGNALVSDAATDELLHRGLTS